MCSHSTGWPASGFLGMGREFETLLGGKSHFLLGVRPGRALPFLVQEHFLGGKNKVPLGEHSRVGYPFITPCFTDSVKPLGG